MLAKETAKKQPSQAGFQALFGALLLQGLVIALFLANSPD